VFANRNPRGARCRQRKFLRGKKNRQSREPKSLPKQKPFPDCPTKFRGNRNAKKTSKTRGFWKRVSNGSKERSKNGGGRGELGTKDSDHGIRDEKGPYLKKDARLKNDGRGKRVKSEKGVTTP